MPRRLITTADDFGLSCGVNEAVQIAATRGILTSASLMVGGPAAEDAVARARDIAGLAVGLHLVVIEGAPVLPARAIPDLVDASGQFPSGQLRLGVDYFFRPAFRATGLRLDHANAHKHMHLHPIVGRLMIEIGRDYGLRAIRVPSEPPVQDGPAQTFGGRALRRWCGVLRGQARRAGMIVPDQVLGLGWTGHMNPARTQHLLDRLPPGLTELYFHPATERNELLERLMPDYEHLAELSALLEATVPAAVSATTYGSCE